MVLVLDRNISSTSTADAEYEYEYEESRLPLQAGVGTSYLPCCVAVLSNDPQTRKLALKLLKCFLRDCSVVDNQSLQLRQSR